MKLCVFELMVLAASPIFTSTEATSYTGGYKSLSAVKRSQLIASLKSKDVNITDSFPNIIGGEPAEDNEFPWFGRTEVIISDGIFTNQYVCGGSLIYSDIVVTAAHCIADDVDGTGASFAITFYLGANDLSGSDGTPLEVETVVWPTNYEFPANDIAYYILSTPADVDPVLFNTNPSIPSPGDIGTAIGFGRTSTGGQLSPVLLKVDLPSISDEECADLYGFTHPDSTTCTFDPEEDQSTCQGDSGGPIIAADGTIFGITSFGGVDTCNGLPNGYTRTSFFTNFTSKVRCDYSAFPPVGCIGFEIEPGPCGLFGLRIFCPFTFGGIIGRFLRALFGLD